MVENVIIIVGKRIQGFPIFIEAIILSFINYFSFGDHKTIINLIIPDYVKTVTDILAILTILLLSLGFIYYMGYFIGARLCGVDIKLRGGKNLSEQVLPYGAIFILAIIICPLMIYLSYPQLSDIRKFIIINYGFVFLCGIFNEFFVQLLQYLKKIQRDKQMKKMREERLNILFGRKNE